MKSNSKIPLIITSESSLLVLEGEVLDDLMANPRAILWNRGGLYSYIPAVRVRNSVSKLKDDIISKKNNNDLSLLNLVYKANSAIQLVSNTAKELAQAIEEMSKLLEKK